MSLCVLHLPKEEPPRSKKEKGSANKRKAFWRLAQMFLCAKRRGNQRGLEIHRIRIWIFIRLM